MNTVDYEPEELDRDILEMLVDIALDDIEHGYPIGFVPFSEIKAAYPGFSVLQVRDSFSRLMTDNSVWRHSIVDSYSVNPKTLALK